jgi:hypothetical protein
VAVVFLRTLAASHTVGLLHGSDQSAAKASTNTGQRNTEDTHVLSGIRTHDLSVQPIKAFASEDGCIGKYLYKVKCKLQNKVSNM